MITKLHFYRDGLLLIMTAWFITKCNGHLLRAATAFSFISKCDRVYYNLRRQVLLSAMINTNCDSTHFMVTLFCKSSTNS